MWQEVPKVDQKALEFMVLVVQLSSLLYAKDSFLIIAWQDCLICWKMLFLSRTFSVPTAIQGEKGRKAN